MLNSRRMGLLGGLMLALPLAGGVDAASAASASMKACSVKYQAAKSAGTLGGQDWKAFRASQCGSGAAASSLPVAVTDTGAAPAPATAATPAATKGATTAADSGPGKSGSAASAPAPGAPAGNATFPTGVDAKYSSLTAGKAREKTCLDQYHANKANGGNGGLKWLQKGGGYYSQCSKKLKGA